jgi:RNA polymerase sigma factor (sigma-70 family)
LDLLALDEALNKPAKLDEEQAKILELRYSGGLNIEQTATVLNISEATVNRDLKAAKAWLRSELTRQNK